MYYVYIVHVQKESYLNAKYIYKIYKVGLFLLREPHKLSVVWSRRSRRVVSLPMQWEPTLQNPYKGLVVWSIPENQQVDVTLFRDPRTNILEDKDWSFIIEDVRVP